MNQRLLRTAILGLCLTAVAVGCTPTQQTTPLAPTAPAISEEPSATSCVPPTPSLATTTDSALTPLPLCVYPVTPSNAAAQYVNTTFGFELYFDALWKHYTTTITQPPALPGDVIIAFSLPFEATAQMPAGYYTALIITVTPASQSGWDYIYPKGNPDQHAPSPTYIARNARYFYGYYTSGALPPSTLTANYDCEVRSVISTFHFVD